MIARFSAWLRSLSQPQTTFHASYNERQLTREEYERHVKPVFDKADKMFREMDRMFDGLRK